MRLARFLRCAGPVAAALITTSLARAAEPCGDWVLVETPNPGSTFNHLTGVARLGAEDALSIGRDGQGPFALMFDGAAWMEIGVPAASEVGGSYALDAVGSTPAGHVWSVGIAFLSAFASAPLAMRHDGSDWDVIESVILDPPGRTGHALAVSAHAEDGVWAVGVSSGGSGGSPCLAIHWDGDAWTEFMPPVVGDRQNNLYGVSALAPNDVWAVGEFQNIIQSPLGFHSLILHWDGTQWNEVPNPGYASASAHLQSVAAVAPDDVWASGYGEDGVLFMHWDGTTWSIVPAPVTVGFNARGLTVLAADDIWATTGLEFLHWNGSTWEVVLPAEVPSSTGISLGHIARIAPCELWSVGSYQPSAGTYARTLAQHLDSGAIASVPRTVISPTIVSQIAAHPNPFRLQTSITFDLAVDSPVRLNVFDVGGRRVLALAHRSYPAGAHAVGFDAGELVPGTYFARLETPEQTVVARLSVCR